MEELFSDLLRKFHETTNNLVSEPLLKARHSWAFLGCMRRAVGVSALGIALRDLLFRDHGLFWFQKSRVCRALYSQIFGIESLLNYYPVGCVVRQHGLLVCLSQTAFKAQSIDTLCFFAFNLRTKNSELNC